MRLDQLNGLLAFQKVAEKGSFSAAALELRVTASALSQSVKQLEERLGVPLFSRTTRSLSLTNAGVQFLERVKPALKEIIDSMEVANYTAAIPSGLLRIVIPAMAIRPVIEPVVKNFLAKYPSISLELIVDDGFTDLVGEGFDAGIRLGETIAKDMTAIRLTKSIRFVVVGSPSYLQKHGIPETVKDLLLHSCIRYRFPDGDIYDNWEFENKGKEFAIRVSGQLIVNSVEIALNAAAGGVGLVYNSEDILFPLIKAGKVKMVLEKYYTKSEGLFLYFTNRTQVNSKLRLFINFLNAASKGAA